MIWSIAWKNVWRKKTRSIVVIISIALGIWGTIFTYAFMIGWVNQRVYAVLNSEVSHMQIHHPKYKENNDMQYTIPNGNKIINDLGSISGVKTYSKRVEIGAMANVSSKSTGVIINGIDVENEKQVTEIYKNIIDSAGTYFDSKKSNLIIIGDKLAKELKLTRYTITPELISSLRNKKLPESLTTKLDSLIGINYRVEAKFETALQETLGEELATQYFYLIKNKAISYKIRSKIILTFQNANGELSGAAFRLAGVFKTSNSMFDGMNVFVRNSDLQAISGFSDQQFHEIAIMVTNTDSLNLIQQEIQAKYPELQVETWREIQPEMALSSDYMNISYYFFLVIILFALSFGIINTMLMVVLERIKEIGMLMAIGMNKMKVFLMIMFETVYLAMVGGFVGMIFSALTVWRTGQSGIDLTAFVGEGMEAMGYSAYVFPEISIDYYFGTGIMIILTALIAAIYPARKALKLNPADAIRSDA